MQYYENYLMVLQMFLNEFENSCNYVSIFVEYNWIEKNVNTFW